mgnify:CR=1 FL=1
MEFGWGNKRPWWRCVTEPAAMQHGATCRADQASVQRGNPPTHTHTPARALIKVTTSRHTSRTAGVAHLPGSSGQRLKSLTHGPNSPNRAVSKLMALFMGPGLTSTVADFTNLTREPMPRPRSTSDTPLQHNSHTRQRHSAGGKARNTTRTQPHKDTNKQGHEQARAQAKHMHTYSSLALSSTTTQSTRLPRSSKDATWKLVFSSSPPFDEPPPVANVATRTILAPFTPSVMTMLSVLYDGMRSPVSNPSAVASAHQAQQNTQHARVA